MAIQTNYTNARAHLAQLCDEVTDNREVVIIQRRGTEDVALISAAELRSLVETVHLLRSPKNAERLLQALNRASLRQVEPQSLAELRQELGLDQESQTWPSATWRAARRFSTRIPGRPQVLGRDGPQSGQPVASGWDPKILMGALLLNGAWGLGTALFLRLFGRILPAAEL